MSTRTALLPSAGAALHSPHPSRTLETSSGVAKAGAEILRDVRVKRVYDPSEPEDGYRVLIDRVWPRGVSRERARLAACTGALAPRQGTWFDDRPPRFKGFRWRYGDELAARSQLLDELRRLAARGGRVTVLNAARDHEHNNAVVLAELLRDS